MAAAPSIPAELIAAGAAAAAGCLGATALLTWLLPAPVRHHPVVDWLTAVALWGGPVTALALGLAAGGLAASRWSAARDRGDRPERVTVLAAALALASVLGSATWFASLALVAAR